MDADWIVDEIKSVLRQSSPEAYAALEKRTYLEVAFAPLVAWGIVQLRDRQLDRTSLSAQFRQKLASSNLPKPEDIPLTGMPQAWTAELDHYLSQASPERHALLAADGTLPERLDKIVENGQTQISLLDLQSQSYYENFFQIVRSMLAEALILERRPQAPLSDDPTLWTDEIRAFFKTSSPENYALAEQQGRLEANLTHLVTESVTRWNHFLSEENPDAVAINTFKLEHILARVSELNRSVVRLKAVHRPKAVTQDEVRRRKTQDAVTLAARSPDFYLYGPARSGTTIIGAALSTSPDIFVLNDTMVLTRFFSIDFMIKLITEVGDKQGKRANFLKALPSNLDEEANVAHVKWLLSLLVTTYYGAGTNPDEPNKNLARFSLHADLLEVDTIIAATRNGCTWRDVFGLVYASLVPPDQNNVRFLGEKTPDNVKFHDFLAKHYPSSRAVCVVRHPLNNIISIYRRYPVKDINKVVAHYLEYIEPVMAMDGQRTLFVRYEDFVADPSREMNRIAYFLDVEQWKLPEQISAYNMPEYTGSGIDKTRNQNVDSIGDRELSAVNAATKTFRARFYPDD